MADRWTDERDRNWRDQDWQRSERYGRGREGDRDRDYGQRNFEGGREREDRTFDPRGGYDDDRGYNQDRFYGAEDRGYGEGGFGGRGYGGGAQGGGWGEERGARYGSESGYGGRYQSGYRGGGYEGGGYRGGQPWGGQRHEQEQDRSRFAADWTGPDRDRVFGERETGDSYRTGETPSQGANYGGAPEYGREPGRVGRQLGGQEHGREQFGQGQRGYGQGSQSYGASGGQSWEQQREYGRGGEHFGQPYGQSERGRGEDYRAGGRFYGDDARQNVREQYGQGGRDYGPAPAGYDTPQWRAGAETYGGRSGAASQGWGGTQREGERWRNRDEREHHTPNVREGRGEGRSWWERTKNQVASFFGDEDAERRSDWDRQSRGYESQGHRGRGPKGYKRSDERITEEVNQRLTDDPWVDASNIDVSVKDCEVTLSGTVSEREDKRRAERVVEDIWGVTHVQNNLRVQQGQGRYGQSGDGDVREGAGSMLGQGSSDTSSRNPITGTGHGFGDTMIATGDPAAAGAASLTDAGRTGTGGQGQTASAASGATGSSGSTTGGSSTASTGSSSTSGSSKDRNK